MTKRLSLVLAILLLSTAAEAKSFALVIGAGDYHNLRPLTKSLQDIELQSSSNPAGDASDFHVSPIGLLEADATFKAENLKTGWWTRSDYSAAHVYTAQSTIE